MARVTVTKSSALHLLPVLIRLNPVNMFNIFSSVLSKYVERIRGFFLLLAIMHHIFEYLSRTHRVNIHCAQIVS